MTTTASKFSGGLDVTVFRLAMVMALGAGASALDTTIVAVTVDRIARQFHVGVGTVQWVSTSYLLAIAVALPVTGWAVDRFGARRMWLLALGVFLVSSAACGAAWSIGSLIAFRVCQGIAGGMIPPLAQTVLVRAGGRENIGRMMTVISVPTQFAPVLGPVLG
ncbi:MAG TPA: MFS transporter, partial [Streptosporangiaceae bacterium]|nr:MFS transporter [Streptosporangiaceae bacterium]